jgi:hypothetical protein
MNFRNGDDLRRALHSLPAYMPPADFGVKLRVVASRERVRGKRHSSLRNWLEWAWECGSLTVQNLMKPVALPFAGGLVSAIALFAMMAPGLVVNREIVQDVPSNLATHPVLKSSFAYGIQQDESDIVVDLLIDNEGRVMDYSIPVEFGAMDPELLRGLQSTLLYTKFAPATVFGKPAAARTRITLRRSKMDVIG